MNTTIKELFIGDMFRFKGDTTLYLYMGVFSYRRGEYLIYKNVKEEKPNIKKLDLSEEVQTI